MAIRRVYFLKDNKIKFQDFDIKWNSGFSIKQKQRNIALLHDEISAYYQINKGEILEISTKSKDELGRELSSFNLTMIHNGIKYPLECVYQSSKVFKNVIEEYQVLEVLEASPSLAKKRLSEEDHNNLIGFRCFGKSFPLEPSYLFYDWLYINSINNISNLKERILKYNYFTDIEFNPQKSHSCQARSLALYKWLMINNRLEDYIKNPEMFYK